MASPTAGKTSTPEEIRRAVIEGRRSVYKNGALVKLTQADRLYILERFRHESGTVSEAESHNPGRIQAPRA